MQNKKYSELFDELISLCHELDDYFFVKKIMWCMVEVWSLGEDSRELFDIFDDDIIWHDDELKVTPGIMRKISDIQEQQRKIIDWFDEVISSR